MTVKDDWEHGIQSEINFWRTVFSGTHPPFEPYRNDMLARANPEAPVDPWIAALVSPARPGIRILDVAAGPISCVGWKLNGERVELTPIDALASHYKTILDEFQITPPVHTQECDGENIGKMFEPESFDVTHIRNALDHCYDPLMVLRNMLAVTKHGGWVLVHGYVDEAVREGYDGLHQWNLCVDEGDLAIWRPGEKFMVGHEFSGLISEMKCTQYDADRWMSASFRRT